MITEREIEIIPNKVYTVIELYECNGVETKVTLFSSFKQAKDYMESCISREEKDSWIQTMINSENLKNLETLSSLEHEEKYYHAYNGYNFYATTIWIEEKQINLIDLTDSKEN